MELDKQYQITNTRYKNTKRKGLSDTLCVLSTLVVNQT